MRSIFNDAYAISFSDFLFKSICCGYSFELPQQVEAVQMGTHNIIYVLIKKIKEHWLNSKEYLANKY